MSSIEGSLRQCVAQLLREGKVKYVLGYEVGSLEGTTRPSFASKPEDASKLVWNGDCRLNLVRFIRGNQEKVAIVVKGCDGRALVELIKDKQVRRDDVIIIAPECPGITRAHRSSDSKNKRVGLAANCAECNCRTSPLYDIILRVDGRSHVRSTDPDKPSGVDTQTSTYHPSWQKLFDQCIKCMACVKACPLCYCTECTVDGCKPALISKLRVPEEMLTFHLIRALHMVGRCVECGACEFACPLEIPLTKLYASMNDEVARIWGYVPGLDVRSRMPLKIAELDGVKG